MFLGLFVVGTLWFWLLVLSVCVVLTLAVEYSRPGWATLSVLGSLFLLSVFGNFNVFQLAAHHPVQALECVGAYVLVGALWSVAKWWFYVRAARERFDDAKEGWFRNNSHRANIDFRLAETRAAAELDFEKAAPGDKVAEARLNAALTAEQNAKQRAEEKMKSEFRSYAKKYLVPSVRSEKSRIMTWMMYWPWSAAWTLINDPVKRAFTAVYNHLRALFEGIVKSAFRGLDLDETESE